MTSAAEPTKSVQADIRTIVGGAVKLGLITAVGVVVFALLSRTMSGGVEIAVQSILVLVGGVVFAFAPALWVRPRDVDSIAWAALVGLLGALVFTVADMAVLRPLNVYHWTWDEIGGGSGFWYIPVWWMGSATLAWLGSWAYSVAAEKGAPNLTFLCGLTIGAALLVFVVLGLLGAGFTAAIMALSFVVALVLARLALPALK